MTKFSVLLAVSTLALLAAQANAWGVVGHQTVAQIGAANLTPAAKAKFNKIIAAGRANNVFTGLEAAATWPDQNRNAGGANPGSHYIDYDDNPQSGQCTSAQVPDECNGAAGCVTSSIGTFAAALASANPNSAAAAQNLALVIHFVGDVAQPLHATGYARGGNQINVKWGRKKTNAHSVWDTQLVQAAADNAGGIDAWVQNLQSLSSDDDASTACVASAGATDAAALTQCAIAWSQESEALTCSAVFGDAFTTGDLSGSYEETVEPVVNQQIARAGLRLSAVLNKVLGGSQ
ncbi:S1/P1 nuclease, partial [Blastocladiella britannica]